jgi:hypothetical protein
MNQPNKFQTAKEMQLELLKHTASVENQSATGFIQQAVENVGQAQLQNREWAGFEQTMPIEDLRNIKQSIQDGQSNQFNVGGNNATTMQPTNNYVELLERSKMAFEQRQQPNTNTVVQTPQNQSVEERNPLSVNLHSWDNAIVEMIPETQNQPTNQPAQNQPANQPANQPVVQMTVIDFNQLADATLKENEQFDNQNFLANFESLSTAKKLYDEKVARAAFCRELSKQGWFLAKYSEETK